MTRLLHLHRALYNLRFFILVKTQGRDCSLSSSARGAYHENVHFFLLSLDLNVPMEKKGR
jgi:methylphosphotriester-DNA--protein-cysteine methyltransferase